MEPYISLNGPDLRCNAVHPSEPPKLTFPGDALLKPGDVFFREGPEEMTLEVLLVRVVLETKGGNRKLGENYLHSMA